MFLISECKFNYDLLFSFTPAKFFAVVPPPVYCTIIATSVRIICVLKEIVKKEKLNFQRNETKHSF